MTKRVQQSVRLLTIVLLTLAVASRANAQATRTWVSGVGNDADPCSRTAPCKTFAGAISKTAASGEIDCLDPGGFGAVTITKSLTIDCYGQTGGILASLTTGIIVNGAGISVNLRNLVIDGVGNGVRGINILQGNSVNLEHVTISGFVNECILLNASGPVNLRVNDASLGECTAGLKANNGARATVVNSRISHATVGIDQAGTSAMGSTVLVTGSMFAGNATALQSVSGAFMAASGNTFSNQTTTVFNQNGGFIQTGNDNPSFGNAAQGATSGALTKF
jgi:hypothetical protein